jgi:hypothetical protein
MRGMLMGSQTKAAADGVSKKMMIVIAAMLAIILLPVTVVSVPTSKVVITIYNTDTTYSVTCHLNVYGVDHGSKEFILVPEDERVLSYSLMAGTYDIYISYSFENDPPYNFRSFGTSFSVSIFETEVVLVDLTD